MTLRPLTVTGDESVASNGCPSWLIFEPTGCTSRTWSTVPAGTTMAAGAAGPAVAASFGAVAGGVLVGTVDAGLPDAGVPGAACPAGGLPAAVDEVEPELEGAVCAGGCEACSGLEDLLLHPLLQRSTAGSMQAASLAFIGIEVPAK